VANQTFCDGMGDSGLADSVEGFELTALRSYRPIYRRTTRVEISG
jgi:hypothetical protein